MRQLLFSLIVLFFAAIANSAYACSCSYGGYWVSDFVQNKVVFRGQVLKSEWLGEYVAENGRPRLNDAETTFRVLTPLKKAPLGEIKIKHSSTGNSCGMNFAMGERDFVTAYEGEGDKIVTNSCTLNAVDEITLLNYFEKGEDVYIPSWNECSEEQIANPQDPKNCYYLSIEAELARADEMSDRRLKEWKARREARKANEKTDE
ncbi:hypothetical protein [Litorimonas sp.]|uniref:hypothetical protein n=1 Tax=Litorimonas sp. TaxID=1892381 RepID=UPI003A8566E3